MGNFARYWFKGQIPFTNELEKYLRDRGFVLHYEPIPEGHYTKVYDVWEVKGKPKYLIHIYAEETNVHEKQEFEEKMKEFGVPIQKWMEG